MDISSSLLENVDSRPTIDLEKPEEENYSSALHHEKILKNKSTKVCSRITNLK